MAIRTTPNHPTLRSNVTRFVTNSSHAEPSRTARQAGRTSTSLPLRSRFSKSARTTSAGTRLFIVGSRILIDNGLGTALRGEFAGDISAAKRHAITVAAGIDPVKVMAEEFTIYADESLSKGGKFSNFYGGSLVRSPDLSGVIRRLEQRKIELGFGGEIKWCKVSQQYLEKYRGIVSCFFDEIEAGRIKTRVMFTQNRNDTKRRTGAERERTYFRLYYQFIKHAFGLKFSPIKARVRLIFDDLPDTSERRHKFRGYLSGLTRDPGFRRAGIAVDPDIAEVKSHNHVVLQCTDIIVGAMQFRLNNLHRFIAPDQKRRGKRTVAKDNLYRMIHDRIRKMRPRFNIGLTTGSDGDKANRWRHHYRHWLFIPTDG